MYKATIDLTECRYLMELHERIKIGLHLDEGYGRNLDAFWDEINRNIKCNYITVKGSKTVSKDLMGTGNSGKKQTKFGAFRLSL